MDFSYLKMPKICWFSFPPKFGLMLKLNAKTVWRALVDQRRATSNFFCILLEVLWAPLQPTQLQSFYSLTNDWFRPFNFHVVKNWVPLVAPRGTLLGSFCIVVTLSVIETIWTKFGQILRFSLRNSVSLSPGPAVKVCADNWLNGGSSHLCGI